MWLSTKWGEHMISRIQNLNEQTVLRVLVAVAVVSLGISALSHWLDGSGAWWGWADSAFQNFSTEMMGAVLTFFLFELVVGVRNEKKRLIIELRSKDNITALNALEQIREKGWHKDGTLKGVNLLYANLQEAKLHDVNLQGALLVLANLQDALLYRANLQSANLMLANLQGAHLDDANLQGANLMLANLQSAHLDDANLQATDLLKANLQGARLSGAKLQGTNLEEASLQAADLRGVEFDEKTVLPDPNRSQGSFNFHKYWTPEIDMSRYTDPKHPDFWQPDWVKEQEK
jgi:hypothetical protein